MDNGEVTFSAPGKVILFGEHAVVYGHPAIVMAINLRARSKVYSSQSQKVTLALPNIYPNSLFTFDEVSQSYFEEKKDNNTIKLDSFNYITNTIFQQANKIQPLHIVVDSDVPSSVGLGSSAAVSVATIASLSYFMCLDFSLKEINEMAFETEVITHGKPSGIDNTIATFGRIQYYKQKRFDDIVAEGIPFYIVVVNSGISRSTKEHVENVAKLMRNDPSKYNRILQQIDDLTEKARVFMKEGETSELGILMNENHQLLELLGVGHTSLSDLRKLLEKHGSLGSKLTGAGGGGCVIGLYDDYKKADLAVNEIRKKGFQAFISDISEKGVKHE